MEVVFEVCVVLRRWVQQLSLEIKQEEQVEMVLGKTIPKEHHIHDLEMVVKIWRLPKME
jgi:hypothetical protein